MKKVIFICRGNLIRSQICKALYNKLKTDDSIAESYGTDVKIDKNEGIKIKKHEYLANLVKIMSNHNMSIGEETSKQLTEDSFLNAFKIIYMGRESKIPKWMKGYDYKYWKDCLNEIEKNKDLNLNIKVPKFGDRQDIEDTILLLKGKVENLIKEIESN